MDNTNKPIPLFSGQHRESIALVTQAEAGQAITVSLADRVHRVAAHLSHVETLQEGDRVLVSMTEYGCVITGRLRSSSESVPPRLAMDNGRLTLVADQAICLQTGRSRIEIHADGRILIDGQQLTSKVDGLMTLTGAIIKLN